MSEQVEDFEHFDGDHPFSRPAGSDASMFIQWKGTDVCLDFVCGDCGVSGHVDAGFAYFIECGACGVTYELGTQVLAKRVAEAASLVVVTEVD